MHSAALAEEYRSLQKSNPAMCGEWLKNLQIQYKLNQTQLAVKLKTNRQVIGRYIRGAKGEKVVSSQTALSRRRSRVQPNDQGPRPAKLEVTAQSLTWMGFLKTLTTPQVFFCLLAIIGLTSYLVQQSIIFFSQVETAQHSIISNAILSEAIPLVAAACFAMSFKPMHKWVLGLILGGSIIGMGFFMHASIGRQMITQSDISKQTHLEREILNTSLTALTQSLSALPAKYVSKRQELIKQINFQRTELSNLKIKTASIGQDISLSTNAAFSFGVWLRVAAMLLNALLVHWVVGRVRIGDAA